MAATDNITERLQQAVIASHPLLCRLNEIGNIRPFSGGRTIIDELEFPIVVEPVPFPPSTWYGGYDVLRPWKPANNVHKSFRDHERNDVLTAAEYPIMQFAIALDGADNDSASKGITNVSNRVSQTISMGGFRDSICSLPDLVSTTPTVGLIGGIARDRWRFWRNLSISHGGNIGLPVMMRLMLDRLSIVDSLQSKECQRPDLILMGEDDFSYHFDKDRKTKYSEWGFESFDFDGAAVVLDKNIKPAVENYSVVQPRIYFLHTKYFHWRSHELRNWKKIDPNGSCDEAVKLPGLYAWAGNLTLNCCYAQGVLYTK